MHTQTYLATVINSTVKPPLPRPPISGLLCLPDRLSRCCAKPIASKRKQNIQSLEKKLDIIEEIKRGKSQRAVAEYFQVAKSTVSNTWKSRERTDNHVAASAYPKFAKRCCIVRDTHFQKLDKACYLRFQQQCAKGAPVSSPLV